MEDWLPSFGVGVLHILQDLLLEDVSIFVCIENVKHEPYQILLVVEAEHHESVHPLIKKQPFGVIAHQAEQAIQRRNDHTVLLFV